MPTAASWTDPVTDVAHLLRFRARTVRRRAALGWAIAGIVVTTLAVAVVPAFVPGAGDSDRALEVAVLLPTAFAGFLALATISAIVSGGGRELLPRDQGAPYPISPTTDHLGALLLAPLNIAWLLQAWALLGSTAYGLGAERFGPAVPVVVLWVAAATAFARSPPGPWRRFAAVRTASWSSGRCPRRSRAPRCGSRPPGGSPARSTSCPPCGSWSVPWTA